MSTYKTPDLQQRRSSATAAKAAMLAKHRALANSPELAKRRAEREAINDARVIRVSEREAARRLRDAELARQAAHAAAQAVLAEREAEKLAAAKVAEQAELAAALAIEQKAARDARYAARKAAKKVRRRGY
jgi:hypothetical protein